MAKCPSCGVPLTSDEARGGECPSCKASLAGGAVKEKPDDSSGITRTSVFFTRCYFCGEHSHCETCYCHVGYTNYWVIFATRHNVRIHCDVCDDCQKAFDRTFWVRIIIGIAMFGLPLLICVGSYFPFFVGNDDPNFRPGAPGAIAAVLGCWCFPWVVSIPLGFYLMRFVFMRWSFPRIEPEREAELRRRLRGWWGMMPGIFCYREKPWLDGDYIEATRM
jgi:hypothetical protein